MTPHRDKGKGTLILDRVFRGVGRIRIASGQSDTVDGRRRFGKMDRMLTELYQDGKHDYLVRLRDRQLAPLQLFAAFQSGRLETLPTAALMLPLAATFAKWAASSPTGKLNKGFRVAVGKLLATIAPAATVGDFPEVVQKRQAVCMAAETPAAFNHFKKHALKTRGSGGYDLNNAVSGCPSLAEETEGKMLQRIAEEKYHVSFQEIADRQTARYRAETGETQEEET